MKRTRVDDRVAVLIAAASGVVAAMSDLSPTGAQPFDAVVVVLSIGFVTWTSAAAPWWVPTLVAGVGAAFAPGPVLIAIGAVACVLGLWMGTRRRDLSLVRGLVGGVGFNVLCRSDYAEIFGLTAVIGIGLAAVVVISGVRRRSSRVRRWVWIAAGVTAAALAIALAGVGIAAMSARSDVADGQRLFGDGIDHLRAGEYVAASSAFEASSAAFGSAAEQMDRPWSLPAQLVPVAAQNRRAVADVAAASQVVSTELVGTSLVIESDALRVSGGRLDLDALAQVSGPVVDSYTALVDLRATIDEVASPWLLGTIERRLDSAAAEFDDNVDRFDKAVMALELMPQMLGGDGQRRYFVAFTTPAEARGLGGFMGNYAELTADDGQLTMTAFGRTAELNQGGNETRTVTGPQDWLDRWGRYGFDNGPDGTTGKVPWSNITVSPQFPSTAQVIAELYPQSGGAELDGVFAMDPYVLEALMGFTGPITIEGTDQRLTQANIVQFLLFDQYLIDNSDGRIDLLAQVAETTIDQLLGGALPGPTVLADELGPLADSGRLTAWARDADEQALFEALGTSAGFPAPGSADGFEVVVNNAGANKLDVYLARAITYRAEFDPATRVITGAIEVTFTNDAPTSGLPSGVIDNYVGDPVGTNRALVSIYTTLPPVTATLDGEPIGIEPGLEAGWHTATAQIIIPSGASRTIRLTVAGSLTTDADSDGGDGGGDGADDGSADGADGDTSYELIVRTQPLYQRPDYDIEVVDTNGLPLVEFNGRAEGTQRLVWPAR